MRVSQLAICMHLGRGILVILAHHHLDGLKHGLVSRLDECSCRVQSMWIVLGQAEVLTADKEAAQVQDGCFHG